jgi:8-oxo-dGTP pyrophosphatase MutT (NUDIX family)/pimeloyl-ACP methyl ester carboxylesterase
MGEETAQRFSRPESVLVVVHTRALECLVLRRVAPADFWQSVTGTLGWEETAAAAAQREVREETGLDPAGLFDSGRSRTFPILPAWRDRFAPDVKENLEHVWYLEIPERVAVTLNPAEHGAYEWLPLEQAIARVSSWTNREALERLRRSDSDRGEGGESVVVVHGLWMPGYETALLRRRLARAGFLPRLFRFRTVADGLDANAERLARFAERLPGDKVHFVGHSLGGVVAAQMLQTHSLARTGRVVCLGSPLRGTHSGKRLARFRWGAGLTGRSIGDLLARGGLAPWSGTADLGVIAGHLPLGLGLLLGALPRPHDGVVSVEETRLAGATDHIVLPLSHTALVFSRTAARQIAYFLRHGRFERIR